MEIDKKPNQEKTIENSEKNILFRFPIFNKTKPYLWLKAVLPEKDDTAIPLPAGLWWHPPLSGLLCLESAPGSADTCHPAWYKE